MPGQRKYLARQIPLYVARRKISCIKNNCFLSLLPQREQFPVAGIAAGKTITPVAVFTTGSLAKMAQTKQL
jgi:hypothetical protein